MATADYSRMKGEGIIRVQRGLFYSGATTAAQLSIPLPTTILDTTMASVRLLGIRDVTSDNQSYPFGRLSLASSTSILLDRTAARSFTLASSVYVAWEVTEYANVRIQRGTTTGEFTMGNAIWTTINTVDIGKSEVHQLGITPNTGNYGSPTACYFASLNASQIGFNAEGSGPGAQCSINWEVVTFNGG